MHRIVMNIKDREDINIDQKNLISQDCRKCNLRRADDCENSMNQNKIYLSKTGVVGVTNKNNKWGASITARGNTINLGIFDNFDDAVEARKEAEIKLFGEFRFDLSDKDIVDESIIANSSLKFIVQKGDSMNNKNMSLSEKEYTELAEKLDA